jgi:dCTP deaminase
MNNQQPVDYIARLPVGTIVDIDIKGLANAGQLIIEEFAEELVKQACYELRASTIFYETGSGREDTRVEIAGSASYVLRPHTYVTVITMECLSLPPNVLGRILTKGQLLSIGLLPVNTYVDPGFIGRLGITLSNLSHRYLLISPGQPIAKAEFTVLPKAVAVPYHGQHGYATGIWPIPTQLFAKESDLQQRGILPDSEQELRATYGAEVAQLVRRFRFYERKVWLQLFLTIAILLAALRFLGNVDWVLAITLGVAGNLATHLLFWIAADLHGRSPKS